MDKQEVGSHNKQWLCRYRRAKAAGTPAAAEEGCLNTVSLAALPIAQVQSFRFPPSLMPFRHRTFPVSIVSLYFLLEHMSFCAHP